MPNQVPRSLPLRATLPLPASTSTPPKAGFGMLLLRGLVGLFLLAFAWAVIGAYAGIAVAVYHMVVP